MRHKKAFRKFSRTPAHRRAMFRNMATSFLEHGNMTTTVEKAKDLKKVVEPLITLGGEDNLHNRRKAYGYLKCKKVVQKLFTEIGPSFKERPGGYTRVVRAGLRAGDAAEMAVIQLVKEELKLNPKKKEKVEAKKEAPKKKAKAKKEEAKEEVVEAAAETEETQVEEIKAEETTEESKEAEATEEAKYKE
jgi:large subunit ribosomal protein L17